MIIHEQTTWGEAADVIVPADARADNKSRLTRFARWLTATGGHWSCPDLAAYRDYLLHEYEGRGGKSLSPTSAAAHLATIRGRYRQILDDPNLEAQLHMLAPQNTDDEARQHWVCTRLDRMNQAIDPNEARINVTREKPAVQHLHLNAAQANTLLCAPLQQVWAGDQPPLVALRDTAMIALLLGTGIRETELVRLNVEDLRCETDGQAALRVLTSRGPARMIPYGRMAFALTVAEAWLKIAKIDSGAVFRGVYRGGRRLREKRVSARAVNQMLERYAIMVGDRLRTVTPYDLRRTYARIAYTELHLPVSQIQANLGHASPSTTQKYIGSLDGDIPQLGNPYSFNVNAVLQVSQGGSSRQHAPQKA